MHDPFVVGSSKSANDRRDDLDDTRHWLRLTAHDRKRLAFDVFEHHEWRALVLTRFMDDHDVLVHATRSNLRFFDEAARELRVTHLHELDRHTTPKLGVARQEHDT